MSTSTAVENTHSDSEIDGALDAGALLPPDTAPAERRDSASTRSYAHPALADRTVVRLTPDGLGAAEDLTMEFLGFAAAAEPVRVGVLRQQALGFPAWALVHDPANGHHALNLVKEIERLTRVAVAKPGLAKDGFDGLAKRLSGAVPHFLPTFYEQAARIFLAAENTALAAGYFNRAREAERGYGLAVDEAAQGAAFLEFALAGALTAKALTEYSRALAARTTPRLAYEQFRRICLERTAGGLPPYSALPADLRRLAKAAGHDDLAEDIAFARELLPLPATLRAAAGFWTAYRAPLLRAAKADPAVRGLLLSIMPTTVGVPGTEDPWLVLLTESGAVAGLTDPVGTLPAEALPADGAGGWLVRYDTQQGRHSGWRYRRVADRRNLPLLALAERMAPRLLAEGNPLALCSRYGCDVDLVDLCLSLGVAVTAPGEHFSIDLAEWLAGVSDRDLSAFAADPRLRPYLYQAIGRLAANHSGTGNALAEAAERLTGVPGLRSVLREWLDDQAALLETGGLVDLDQRLRLLDSVARPLIVAVNPDAFRRMAALDVGSYLGHALRSGIFDEYGWPALEEACTRLAGLASGTDPQLPKPVQHQGRRAVFQRGYRQAAENWQLSAQWPYLVVQSDLRTAVIDGAGTRLEHTVALPTPPNGNIYNAIVRYVDGQIMVAWNGHPSSGAYFTGDPTRIFTDEVELSYGTSSLELPWGGRTFGGRPLTAGSPTWSTPGNVASDGTDYWVFTTEPTTHQRKWFEFDPRTGAVGRASMPGFFGKPLGAAGDWTLRSEVSSLMPSAAGMQASPLGTAGELVGTRTFQHPDGSQICEGVDGRTVTLRPTKSQLWPAAVAVGIMSFPGAAANLAIVRPGDLHLADESGKCVAILTPGQQCTAYARGTWCVPPVEFWHYLTVRDAAGSAALRALTDEQAAALTAAAADDQRAETEADSAADEAEFDPHGLLPQVTNSKLRAGIAGYARIAGTCQRRLRSMVRRIDADLNQPEPVAAAPLSWLRWDGAFARGRRGLCPVDTTDHNAGVLTPGEVMRLLNDLLTKADKPTEQDIARLGFGHYQAQRVWAELIQAGFALPALAYRAVSAGTGPAERAALLEFVRLWAASPLTAPGSAIRLLTTKAPETAKVYSGTVLDTGHSRAIVLNFARWIESGVGAWYTIEYSPEGRFAALPDWTIVSDLRPMPWPGKQIPIAEFCDLAAARGVVPVRPEQERQLAEASGLSTVEARMLLAGLPTKAFGYGEQLSAEVRETLDLKPAAIKVAAKRFSPLSVQTSVRLVAALMPEDPASLWTEGARLDAAAEQWIALKGRQVPLPEDVAAAADKVVSVEIAQGLVNPSAATWLAGTVTVGGVQQPGGFSVDHLASGVKGLVWLAYFLPTGDPLRTPLLQSLAALRERAKDPEFSFRLGYTDKAGQMAEALGYQDDPSPDRNQEWRTGPFKFGSQGEWRTVDLFPAELTGADDPVLAYLAREDSFAYARANVNALILLLSDDLARLLTAGLPAGPYAAFPDQNADAQAAAGTYVAQDPSRSVPELLAEVAGKLGLSQDAATLYLMLLALPDPTDRNQSLWTGWKPARVKAARTELADTDLVVSGSRPRAGRTMFLPGGWHAMKAPHLPVEAWKGPLLGVGADGSTPLGVVLPRIPVADLFAEAWNRVQAGDAPRYDELTTGKKR